MLIYTNSISNIMHDDTNDKPQETNGGENSTDFKEDESIKSIELVNNLIQEVEESDNVIANLEDIKKLKEKYIFDNDISSGSNSSLDEKSILNESINSDISTLVAIVNQMIYRLMDV